MLKLSGLLVVLSFICQLTESMELDEFIFWPLRKGLNVGSVILLEGETYDDNDKNMRFEIDLTEDFTCTEDLSKTNSMLHISVRYGKGLLVFNNYVDGQYKEEQRHYDLSIKTNSMFTISITVLADKFHVVINGKIAFDFFHRLPYSRIKRLIVRKNVCVRTITLTQLLISVDPSGK